MGNDIGAAAVASMSVTANAEPQKTMNRGAILTAVILFAIAIGIYIGFIFLVGNADL